MNNKQPAVCLIAGCFEPAEPQANPRYLSGVLCRGTIDDGGIF
jgi:hypothetical protein